MAGQNGLAVALVTPEATVFEGEAESVVVPAWDGEVGILRGHAPMMALLGDGEMRITGAGGTQRFHVSGGFVEVAGDVVSVMSERATAE